MKKQILISFIVLLTSCAEKAPENGALILGQASGLDPDDIITAVLFQHEGGVGRGIQTDTLKNGHFVFRLDSLAEADHYMVSLLCQRPETTSAFFEYTQCHRPPPGFAST